ncbi:MAG: WYL domain-containing transcriptional regulator [Deltaproteobacteria bacterium]|nr:WYL domain-containing transcriptional regulator [Deltaproteobacteria bacterium]
MARGDQLSRTLVILNKLYTSRQGVAINDLASEFKTSTKTIRRDLCFLENSLFPLVEHKDDQGKKRFKLMQGYKEEFDVPFAPAELMSLYFFKDFLAPLEGTGFEVPFRRLINKIENGIPEQAKAFCDRLEKSFRTRIAQKVDYTSSKIIVQIVNNAICDRRPIKIKYFSYSSKRTTIRKIEPYCLYYYHGAIYVVAKDFLSRELRTFNVERIRKAIKLDSSFSLPKNFNAADYFKESFGIFKDDIVTVVAVFDNAVSPFIQERIWHPHQRIETLTGGRVKLTIPVAGTREIKTWLMGFCEHVEVVEPQSLREEIIKDIKKMGGVYS